MDLPSNCDVGYLASRVPAPRTVSSDEILEPFCQWRAKHAVPVTFNKTRHLMEAVIRWWPRTVILKKK